MALVLTLIGCARHRSVASVLSGEQGHNLSALVRGLVSSQMGDAGLVLFYAAGLLRRGRVAQLKRALDGLSVGLLELAASCVPLLQIEYDHGIPSTFVLHDLGVTAFEHVSLPQEARGVALESALRELEREGRHADCVRVLLRQDAVDGLAEFLERWGDSILAQGHVGLLRTALDSFEPATFLRRPGLLLLQAMLLREDSRPSEAVSKATVARDLARADDDAETLMQALETIARASIDMGCLADAEASLRELLSLDQAVTSASSRALAGSYLAICSAVDGRVDEAMSQLREAHDLLQRHHIQADVEGRVATHEL